MAGTIRVSKGHSLATSTRVYDFIAEKTRPHFLPDEQHILKEIYHGEDDAAMMFISVKEVDRTGFNAFYRATKKGYEQALIEHPDWAVPWKELIDMLETDPRFDGVPELKISQSPTK
jgi:hypothetical protein